MTKKPVFIENINRSLHLFNRENNNLLVEAKLDFWYAQLPVNRAAKFIRSIQDKQIKMINLKKHTFERNSLRIGFLMDLCNLSAQVNLDQDALDTREKQALNRFCILKPEGNLFTMNVVERFKMKLFWDKAPNYFKPYDQNESFSVDSDESALLFV